MKIPRANRQTSSTYMGLYQQNGHFKLALYFSSLQVLFCVCWFIYFQVVQDQAVSVRIICLITRLPYSPSAVILVMVEVNCVNYYLCCYHFILPQKHHWQISFYFLQKTSFVDITLIYCINIISRYHFTLLQEYHYFNLTKTTDKTSQVQYVHVCTNCSTHVTLLYCGHDIHETTVNPPQ